MAALWLALVWQAWRGVARGKIWMRGFTYDRATQPPTFWITLGAYGVLIVFLSGVAIALLLKE